MGNCGLDWLAQAVSSELVNEPSGSIKCEEFLGQPKKCYIFEKQLAPWSYLVYRVS